MWAAYCRQVWAKIRRLCQEACYGCSHRKTDERHHNTCQMSDQDRILRFMEMALGDVWCLEVIREWYDWLSGLKPPLSENEMLVFDTPWVLQQMGLPDRTAILVELMVEHNIVQPSMSDEELLEAVEAVERQQQQPNVMMIPTCLSLAINFAISPLEQFGQTIYVDFIGHDYSYGGS